ncbi:MAG: tetratricopeptide repeat protein [Anaerolineales bacterium]
MPDNVKQQIVELKNAIATLESQRAVLGDAVVEASISALHKQLAELERETEPPDRHKKLVSMLFVDIVGSTSIGQHLEPDEILEIMDGGLQRLARPIEAHGGRVTRFMGDGFKAVFGEPTAQENDAEMAVRAGLEILEDAKAYAVELEEKWHLTGFNVRIGINTGMVAIGGITESDDTVMGLTVNLGARLESAAPIGGLLISQTTYRHVRGIFEFESLPPVEAKGFDEPIPVYLVVGSKPKAFHTKTRGVEGVNTRMIGREADLKRLQDAYFAAVEDSECQVVTVIGEAGIGKSRLLEEFENWMEERPDHAYLLKGRSSPEFQDSPYSLLRNMFSHRFQIQASDRVKEVQHKFEAGIGEIPLQEEKHSMWAHFIGQLLGFDFTASPYLVGVLDDAMQLRDRAWIYLGEFIKSTATSTPVIVFLDDVHWADDNSLDVVNYLAQSLSNQPVLIICLARSLVLERRPLWGEGQKSHTKLDLDALSTRDCRRLVEDILQKMGQVPLALRELVVSGAEGNPFYIEELIKMLIDSGVIHTGSERWLVDPTSLADILADLNVPSTLTALLQARLDQLDPDERNVLQQASVVGRVFWDDVIHYLSSTSSLQQPEQVDISALLETLRQKEMIYHREISSLGRAQEYSFKHTILRDVTYDSILKKVRQSYHALVVEWLLQESVERSGEFTGMIAEHLELAGETQRAVAFYRQAGEQAARQYANQSALKYLGHALELTSEVDLDERYHILFAREQVYSLLGSRNEQGQDLEQLVELAAQLNDEHKRGEVALLQAAAASETSNYPLIISHAQEVIRISQSLHIPRLETRANLLLGRALLSKGEYPHAEACFNQALQLAEKSALSNLKADSLRYLGVVSERLGNLSNAIDHFEKSLQLYRQIGDRRGEGKTLNQLGNILLLQGDHTGGMRYYDQFLKISREIGDRWGEGQVIRNIANTYLNQYDYGGASKYFEQALEITREIGNRTIESSALVGLGNMYLEQGEYTKAKDVFEQSLNIAREIGNKPWEAKTLSQIGRYFHRQGDYLRAKSYFEQAIDIYQLLGNQLSSSRVLVDLSLLHHHLGDDETALQKGKAALRIAEESGHPKYLGRSLTQTGRALAGLGNYEGAEKHYQRAKDSYSQINQDNLQMEPLAGLSAVCLAAGNQASAKTHVDLILNHLESAQTSEVDDQPDQAGAVPGLAGTRDPMWIYLMCFRVLAAVQDQRAGDILRTAQSLVEQQASKISDPDLHYSFLNNVKANQEIQSLYERGGFD